MIMARAHWNLLRCPRAIFVAFLSVMIMFQAISQMLTHAAYASSLGQQVGHSLVLSDDDMKDKPGLHAVADCALHGCWSVLPVRFGAQIDLKGKVLRPDVGRPACGLLARLPERPPRK